MDQQQVENTIQFLVDNRAKFHSDLELMKEGQQRTDAQIHALVESQQVLTDKVEAMRLEMREAFDNLIIGNEVTRNFANKLQSLL